MMTPVDFSEHSSPLMVSMDDYGTEKDKFTPLDESYQKITDCAGKICKVAYFLFSLTICLGIPAAATWAFPPAAVITYSVLGGLLAVSGIIALVGGIFNRLSMSDKYSELRKSVLPDSIGGNWRLDDLCERIEPMIKRGVVPQQMVEQLMTAKEERDHIELFYQSNLENLSKEYEERKAQYETAKSEARQITNKTDRKAKIAEVEDVFGQYENDFQERKRNLTQKYHDDRNALLNGLKKMYKEIQKESHRQAYQEHCSQVGDDAEPVGDFESFHQRLVVDECGKCRHIYA